MPAHSFIKNLQIMLFRKNTALAIVGLLLLPALSALAQNPYADLDEEVRQLRVKRKTKIPELAAALTQNRKTEMEKCRAIFVWIVENITYDMATLEKQKVRSKDKLPSQEAADVLADRLGVCEGYTNLFMALCQQAGIRTVAIPGKSKSAGEVSNVGHIWLMAYADGRWRLFDPTWGSGHRDADTQKFQRKFSETYFDASPEALIQTHYPSDPLAQMLPKPLTFDEFKQGVSSERLRQKTEPGDPMGFQAWQDSVEAWLKLDPRLQTLRAAERALWVNPDYGEALTRVGAWHYDNAVDMFNEMIDKSNQFVQERRIKPKSHYEEEYRQIAKIREKIETAKSFFEKVPRSDYAWRNAGPYLESLRNLKESVKAFEADIKKTYKANFGGRG